MFVKQHWWIVILLLSGCADRHARYVEKSIKIIAYNLSLSENDNYEAITAASSITRDHFIELSVPILEDMLKHKGMYYEIVPEGGIMKYDQFMVLSETKMDAFLRSIANDYYDRVVAVKRRQLSPKKNQSKKANKAPTTSSSSTSIST